jgi:hypothetical protein
MNLVAKIKKSERNQIRNEAKLIEIYYAIRSVTIFMKANQIDQNIIRQSMVETYRRLRTNIHHESTDFKVKVDGAIEFYKRHCLKNRYIVE